MNKRLVTVLGFSFLVASAVTLLLYSLLASRLRNLATPASGQEIVVAARDLQRGELIKDPDLKVVNWGASSLPKGAMADKKAVLGRGVVSEIASGEPVLEGRLAPKEAGAGLAPSIPVGKRAVSLRVNDVVAVAGYVIPGSRVDVLVIGNAPGQTPQGSEIRTILQNIEVLSAGTNIQRDAEGKPVQVPVVTVLVTPEEAETLSLASTETRVQLVLRNPMDGQKSEPKGTAVARLFRDLPPPAVARPATSSVQVRKIVQRKPAVAPAPVVPPPPPPIVVELLRGPSRSSEKFEERDKKERDKTQ